MEIMQTSRRVERLRHELRRREVQVARVEPLGSGFVRVVFEGSSLEGFTSPGFDDHVKFVFDDVGSAEPIRRDYTPRRFDAARRELTIDFAVHGGGLACAWARNATAGQLAVIGGPRGSMVVPTDYDWHLFAGDATALPAIGRRLCELPASARAIVIVQAGELAVLELAQSSARVELRQVATADALVAAIGALQLPPGEGYAWCAGEASSMARIRGILIDQKLHPREAMRVAAYWKRGASDYHEDLAR